MGSQRLAAPPSSGLGRVGSLLVLALFCVPGTDLRAADPPPPAKPRFGNAVRSPEVSADGRVTFRFSAPGAKRVFVHREGLSRLEMKKDENGVWTATTEPLAPDFYTYSFVVDGVGLGDPANTLVKPVISGGNQSLAHVPSPSTLAWEQNNVAHGVVHRHTQYSKVIGETRDFLVYTPPGYDAAAKERYPVLYLLHGVMDDESAWTGVGRAQVILDNLLAAKKAKPMLLVMPLGYGFPNAPDRIGEQFGPAPGQRKFLDAMTAYLVDEVIPQVEHDYRAAPERDARAIAGLSMGGTQALFIGLNHPDRFGWIGSFSGALIMCSGPFANWFPELSAKTKTPPRLLWIGCGTEDFLIGVNRRYRDWLKTNGVECTAIETPGAHAWTVWRRNLCDFAPLLFRDKSPGARP